VTRKHIPQRTCIGCRQVKAKRTLVRVVRTPTSGVRVDASGKMAGRGAYLCRHRNCWEAALHKGAVEQALKTTLSTEERATLEEYARELPTAVQVSGSL